MGHQTLDPPPYNAPRTPCRPLPVHTDMALYSPCKLMLLLALFHAAAAVSRQPPPLAPWSLCRHYSCLVHAAWPPSPHLFRLTC